MRREVASFDVIFYGNASGHGKTMMYDERQFVQGLNANDLATLYRNAMKVREDEFNQMVHLSPMFHSKTRVGVAVEWIHAMSSFYSRAIQRRHYTLMFEQKQGFIEAYQEAVDDFIKSDIHDIQLGSMLGIPAVKEAFLLLHARLVKRYQAFIFKTWSNQITENTIVITEQFIPSYFNQLHENIRGFVYQKEINKDTMQRYADHFHIPMVTTSYPFINGEELTIDSNQSSLYLNTQMDNIESDLFQKNNRLDEITPYPIKIYASLSDQRFIHQIESSDTLQGICVYQTEYMYHTKGTIPSVEEFTACFQTILETSKNQEIYIALPNIKPSMSIDYLPNHYLDLELYDEYPALINHLIKGIEAVMKETRKIPKIVVPMIRVYKEVEAWTTIIESMFEDINSVIPDIGFMMETESALEYHEDFKGLKFAIIGMDNLIEELIDHPTHLENLSFHDIKCHFWQDLKEMHQFFRGYSNQTKHIVMGKSLKNPALMDKLIKAGFQAFALPIQDIPSITPVIKRHIATRGKYKGIHEARKQKNHQNRMVFEE